MKTTKELNEMLSKMSEEEVDELTKKGSRILTDLEKHRANQRLYRARAGLKAVLEQAKTDGGNV